MLFAGELQRRARGAVISVSLHPGEVLTDVVRSLPGPMQRAYRLLLQTIMLTPQQGALLGGRLGACCAAGRHKPWSRMQQLAGGHQERLPAQASLPSAWNLAAWPRCTIAQQSLAAHAGAHARFRTGLLL